MPAARLFLGLGLASLLLVAALLAPAWLDLAIAGDLALLAAFGVDLLLARQVRLEATRRWPPLLVQGARGTVSVELRRAGSRRPLEVWLRDGLSPALAAAPLRIRLRVPPEGCRWSYELVPRRRGEAVVAPLFARVLGPLGLAWSQRQVLAEERCRVYPQVRWQGRVGHLLALAQRHQLGSERTPLQGAGGESYGLREYLPGDPLSRVHWKATARHGRLVTREETWERGARLVILLDCARTMTAREGDRSKLDHALAASLALARVASSRGDRVTFVTFSDQVERVVRLPAGQRGPATAYGALYDLAARQCEPAYDLAAAEALRVEGRAATTVLFSSVVDLAAAELLREALHALERRHRPLLVNLEDPEIIALANRPPASTAAAYAQVDALEILLANRRLGRSLRRSGVRVVAAPADRLALESLEGYLALFRGGAARSRARAR